jgi:hypothetical protein
MDKEIISFNAKAFVIPNRAVRLVEFSKQPWMNDVYKYLLEMASLNNIELNDDDEIIQLWFHSEELESDNLCDHGFNIRLNNGRMVSFRPKALQWVPLKLLESINEGDSLLLISPSSSNFNIKRQSSVDAILHISMICQQQGYRYQSFGNFEDVVKKVCK